MYAAIVGNERQILLHSDSARVGKRLDADWYEEHADDLGDGVVRTTSSILGTGETAYDLQVPISVHGTVVGTYHAGVGLKQLSDRLAPHQREFWQRLAVLVSGVLLIGLLATTSLYYIAAHSIALRRSLDDRSLQKATEVGSLAAGLAHEIRNPLHAIQLNLHTLRRAEKRGEQLQPSDMHTLLEECIREIDRIDQLMHQLVGFATPERPRDEIVNLTRELSSIVDFLCHELMRSSIKVALQLPPHPVTVQMDSGRLRQVMLNLIQNAQQALVQEGQLRISLRRQRRTAEILVADDGPGILPEVRQHIFEPFFSTKQEGTGLGLALVKRFVEEADGEIDCVENEWGGTTFRIVLPVAYYVPTRRTTS